VGVYSRLNAGASLSGNERNDLFLSEEARQFARLSGVSGADFPEDARGFALLDYDRDGWQDFALVNANAPWFRLLRNEIPDSGVAAAAHRVIAVRFVGGNRAATPSAEWSARDGFGAIVKVDLSERSLTRELRAGEGFAAQNSTTMLIGIGDAEAARRVTVRWPSGVEQTAVDVPADTLLTVHENPADSAGGQAFVSAPYKVTMPSAERAGGRGPRLGPLPGAGSAAAEAPLLRLYTTMATWCVSCLKEMPVLKSLRSGFTSQELGMFGVPVDPNDTLEKLRTWLAANDPAYELLLGLGADRAAAVQAMVTGALKAEGVPATLVTDAEGNVLLLQWGPPTASQLHELLSKVRAPARVAATRGRGGDR
jgi:hypothetical protein